MENMEQRELDELLLKYKMASKVLSTGLDNLIDDYKFQTQTDPVEHMKCRVKKIGSATKKLEKKGYELTPDNLKNHVHDMVGVRIVCTLPSEVDEIVSLIHDSGLFEITEVNDYISHPKESGYQSYHMNVLVPISFQDSIEYVESEIQIRDVSMDYFAAVEHKIQYKSENLDPDVAAYIREQMFQCSQYLSKVDEKMQELGELQASDSKRTEKGKMMRKEYQKN